MNTLRHVGRAGLICLIVASLADAANGIAAETQSTNPAPRRTVSFDADWRFFQGAADGAERPEFNDRNWRRLDVPHDWSIEGPFARTNRTGGAGGYLPSGIGWYRKSFSLPETDRGRSAWIEFDGVMANSDVWIN